MRGLGPICFQRVAGDSERHTGDQTDIPFDPDTKNIVCFRDREDVLHFNVFQVYRHHSPTGMGWGYAGSGAADFALNIMAHFVNNIGRKDVRLWDKQFVSRLAWDLHQRFKRSRLFGSLEKDGGTLYGKDITAWIAAEQKIMESEREAA